MPGGVAHGGLCWGPSPGENEKSQCEMMVIIDDYSTYMLYGVYIYM